MPAIDRKFVSGWLGRFFPIVVLTVIVGWLFVANYEPGTWLSGWDTLHPEFNFSLYWERVYYGAWQEHQGLGAPAAQGHASEIPRVLILFLMSLFLPDSMLRYLFMFLCLWLGALGVYVFSHRLVGTGMGLKSRLVATVSALVYLLNLTVVQQFYVPLEMFAVHYAALPWLSYFLISYWKSGSRKSLWDLLFASIFGAPMAHTSTLWYVMFGGFGLVGISWVVLNKLGIQAIKRVALGLTLLLATNLFWILPNIYYIVNHSQVVSQSTIHSTFSEEAFLQGRVYGRWNDVLLQKNFLFNWRVFDYEQDEFVDLLSVWKEHVDGQIVIQLIAHGVWLVALIGFVVGIKRRRKEVLVFVPMLLMSVVFWVNANPPFTEIFTWLRDNYNLFREGLRFPFTKFSIMMIFSLSVLFGLGLDLLASRYKTKKALIVASVVCSLALVGLAWPMFQGHLTSPAMKVQFPDEYFEVFDWFETQPRTARVAKLPLHTYWGWNYYDWGYQGAGFTWFGIPQPTLDREFDRWGRYNEGFYNELSFAVYGMDLELVDKVLNKYQVQYLLMDESVINPGGTKDVLFIEEMKDNFAVNPKFELVKQAGFLSVYKFDLDNPDWIWSVDNPKIIDADLTYVNYDPVYDTYGNYVNMEGGNLLPFANLDWRSDLEIEFGEYEIEISQKYKIPKYVESISLPNYLEFERNLPLEVYVRQVNPGEFELRLELKQPNFTINNQEPFFGRSIWVTEVVPYDLTGISFIGFNESAFRVDFDSPWEEFSKIGTFLQPANQSLEISFYTNTDDIDSNIVQGLISQQPRLCSNPDRKLNLDNVEMGEIKLEVQDEAVCLGNFFELEQDSLLEISYKTETESGLGLFPWLCVSQEIEGGCINDILVQDRDLSAIRTERSKIPIKSGRVWVDLVAQTRDLNAGSGVIAFRDLEVNVYPQTDTYNLDIAALFSQFSSAEIISLNIELHQITTTIPVSEILAEDFSYGRGNPKATNCDLFGRGEVSKRMLFSGALLYEASDDGSSCDFFDYRKVAYDQSYLLRLRGYNLEGQGLRLYLRNQTTGKTDLEHILNQPEFDQAFALPGRPLNGRGYTINLESKSYERFVSRNQVSEVSLWPVPLKWLSLVALGGGENQGVGGAMITSNLRINNSSYLVNLDNNLIDNLNNTKLSQAFDPGWIAYAFEGDSVPWIQRWLPFLGGERLEQVRVNGWSNGWIVDSNKQQATSDKPAESAQEDTFTVVIIYWPQYLQWIGFGVLGLAVVGLMVGLYLPRRRAERDKSEIPSNTDRGK